MPIAVWAEPRLNGKWYIIELKITVGEEDLFEDFSSLAKESLSRLLQVYPSHLVHAFAQKPHIPSSHSAQSIQQFTHDNFWHLHTTKSSSCVCVPQSAHGEPLHADNSTNGPLL